MSSQTQNAANAGQIEPVVLGEGRRPRRVRDVDFSRPTKFTPDQQRRFERAHESFCRGSSTRLSTELRNPLQIGRASCRERV